MSFDAAGTAGAALGMREERAISAVVQPVLEELQGCLLADEGGEARIAGLSGLNEMIAGAIGEARFLQEDAVLEALEELERFLQGVGDDLPSEDLLPKLFALQETIQSVEVTLPPREEGRCDLSPFVDWDAQLDLHEVSRLDEQGRFLLDGALSRGQEPYLVRLVLAGTDLSPSRVVQVLEDHFFVLKGVVTEARARVTALVVHAGEPPLESVLRESFGDQAGGIDSEIRLVPSQWFSGSTEGTNPWVQAGPVLPLSLSPALLDRLRFLTSWCPEAQGGDPEGHPESWLRNNLCEAVEELLSVPLGDLTERVRAGLNQIAADQEKPLLVSFGGGVETVPVEVGPFLRDALEELLKNALTHGIEEASERERAQKPRQGQVRVFISREEGQLLVRVSDDGRGLDEDQLRDLFDSPEQSSGLFRLRDALENGLGGRLAVKGGARGTTVTLAIPWQPRPWRGLLGGRGDSRFVVPVALVEDMVPIHSSDVVRDSSGGAFIRYREQLVALEDHGADEAPLALIVPGPKDAEGGRAGVSYRACALDYAPQEVAVFPDGAGTVSIPSKNARGIPVVIPGKS
ncbi:Histidine kinase-, DNA gyrase B-, and HSP90-like ATPase [Alkalispirochaeta americana]|uniref:Histidine kinase-, DNA gyrase B-, and HSP90-like ATPase n=1 Tax=Alkalispirochaeta americana TaxID=159291 RepID=A0A1N6PNB9_9SPIO|nr:ATP-binding protein [Alkalispirochaeta americana]SIQ05821.1 Histidine kinase-, DNA gyrase B-, and HSP90-like ATPase [Alkalispirochaeta americana]